MVEESSVDSVDSKWNDKWEDFVSSLSSSYSFEGSRDLTWDDLPKDFRYYIKTIMRNGNGHMGYKIAIDHLEGNSFTRYDEFKRFAQSYFQLKFEKITVDCLDPLLMYRDMEKVAELFNIVVSSFNRLIEMYKEAVFRSKGLPFRLRLR